MIQSEARLLHFKPFPPNTMNTIPPTELETQIANAFFLNIPLAGWVAFAFVAINFLGFWLVVRHMQKHGRI